MHTATFKPSDGSNERLPTPVERVIASAPRNSHLEPQTGYGERTWSPLFRAPQSLQRRSHVTWPPLLRIHPHRLTCGVRVLTVFPPPPLRDSGSDQHGCTSRAARRPERNGPPGPPENRWTAQVFADFSSLLVIDDPPNFTSLPGRGRGAGHVLALDRMA